MAMGWLIGGALYFSWGAVAVFVLLSGVTLCFGHSLGMHRKLIHESYSCSDFLEKVGVWLGTLVGLGGPFTMMYTHDIRDWAQRQRTCHPFLSHQSAFLKDGWWQLHCKLYLEREPEFQFPKKLSVSRFYRFIEKTAMLQQVPLAVVLWLFGGWGYVFWGVCGRVTISILGHWLIGYFAHNCGHRDWNVDGAAVQGHNVLFCGLITFGECWHNNHHAFPGSARLGLYDGQFDPGWLVLRCLERWGLASGLAEPKDLPTRPELRRLGSASSSRAEGDESAAPTPRV
ncbi:MAG: acyl-CoA desaturase [Pseudomonadota bacterium]